MLSLKRKEVTGSWTKLHYTERHGLYSSPIFSGVIRNKKSKMDEIINSRKILVGKTEGTNSNSGTVWDRALWLSLCNILSLLLDTQLSPELYLLG